MKFYILKHGEDQYQIIGTRQSLPPLPSKVLVLKAEHDLDWTVTSESDAITVVTALDAGYNLHRKISETASSGYHAITITK